MKMQVIKKISKWKGRSIAAYKHRNEARAEELGLLDKLMAAKTLTKAKKIMGGKNE